MDLVYCNVPDYRISYSRYLIQRTWFWEFTRRELFRILSQLSRDVPGTV